MSVPSPFGPAARDLCADHQQCYACGNPDGEGLGLCFEKVSDGSVRAIWQPVRRFQSYPGRLHGGVIATLLDSAMVHALFARQVRGVTAELHVRYLRAVQLDAALELRASVDSCRLSLYVCQAELIQHSRIVVRATAKFMSF